MKGCWLFFALLLTLLAGCGGGGAGTGTGTTFTLSGTVVSLTTGGPPAPVATVQAADAATSTNTTDGSFILSVPAGTNSVLVLFTPPGGSPVSFRFDIPPVSANTDVGDLVVGPEKARVHGKVINAQNSVGIAGAVVRFAGKQATTGAGGVWEILDVAYDSANISQFLSLSGTVTAGGYLSQTFSPSTAAVGSDVLIDDIALIELSGPVPPGLPANLVGTVSPSNLAPGTVISVRQGGTLIRQFTVGTANVFGFWLPPGTYTINVQNPLNSTGAPDITVTLTRPDEVIRRDVVIG